MDTVENIHPLRYDNYKYNFYCSRYKINVWQQQRLRIKMKSLSRKNSKRTGGNISLRFLSSPKYA